MMFIDTDNEIPTKHARTHTRSGITPNRNVSRDLRSKEHGKKGIEKWYTQILKMTEIAIKIDAHRDREGKMGKRSDGGTTKYIC